MLKNVIGFLNINIGEMRGDFMAEKRRQAFIKVYNKEPNWFMSPQDENGKLVRTDFIKACELVNMQESYQEFENLVLAKLEQLRHNRIEI